MSKTFVTSLKMGRSMAQLAGAYSPGSINTFEGGRGLFFTVPSLENEPAKIPTAMQNRIWQSLEDILKQWVIRGQVALKDKSRPNQLPLLVEAEAFIDVRQNLTMLPQRFNLVTPNKMGMVPFPLLLRCNHCGLVVEFDDSEQMNNELDRLDKPCPEKAGKSHSFNQVDVVFAHWSGAVEPLSPRRRGMDKNGNISMYGCQVCNAREGFRLLQRGNQFRSWKYVCSGCQDSREISQKDAFYLNTYGNDPGSQGADFKDFRMLPVSARASALHYVHQETLLDLGHDYQTAPTVDQLLPLLQKSENVNASEQLLEALRKQLSPAQFKPVQTLFNGLAQYQDDETLSIVMEKAWRDKLTELKQEGIFTDTSVTDPLAARLIASQENWNRRLNPVRLVLEHKAFQDILKSSDVMNLRDDAQQPGMERSFEQLGIAEAKLFKHLNVYQVSMGYSRVSNEPVTEQHGLLQAVRLMAFPAVDSQRHRPIYVLHQQNEAIYIRLNPELVTKWLLRNGEKLDVEANDITLRRQFLDSYQDPGPFWQSFRQENGEQLPTTANLGLLLLHTMAHHWLHAIATFSGLEAGSLKEYLFPADFAFLIYRQGLTSDLANLSSMWQNDAEAVLDHLLDARELWCDAGDLCDTRGGACPGCLMVPETSCQLANQVLSRAALAGGPSPLWLKSTKPLVGYFELTST